MAREIVLNQLADAQEAVQAAVAELEAGNLVCLPDECGWHLLGLSTRAGTAAKLQAAGQDLSRRVETVVLAHPQAVADYMTEPSRLFLKLGARCWPGPVVLRGGEGRADGLIRQWPQESQKWGATSQGRAFFCPAEPVTQHVLRGLSAPALGLLGCHDGKGLPGGLGDQASLIISTPNTRFSEPPTVVGVTENGLQVEQPGVVSERMLARLAGEVFLFVCTGNTCRSPMAEAMFRKFLADRLRCREDELLDRGYIIVSAGLAACQGAAASPEAVELLRRDGIDLNSHESQPVTEDLLLHCDRIITMTRNHRDAVLSAFPDLAGQVRLLSSEGLDISDPMGAGINEYTRCRDEIASHLQKLLDEIVP